MRKAILVLAALSLSTGALAQGMPGGGMPGGGMPGGGMGGGPPGGEPPEGGPPGGGRPPPMKPLHRDKFDKAVVALFRSIDSNRDGIVTLAEFNAIIDARRDRAIQERFEGIDGNRNGIIEHDEFFAWQKKMGSVALSDSPAAAGNSGPIAETVEPELGDSMRDMILAQLIEPVGALTVVGANTDHDAGMSLDELLVYERKRFDAADTDKDGWVTMEEAQAASRPKEPRGPGRRPPFGGPPPGGF